MKRKLIAIILCIAMLIPCAMLNSFAEEPTVESGTVLYYQKFGKNGDKLIANDIPSAGLNLADVGAASIDPETGYLAATSVDTSTTTRKKVVILKDIIPEDDTYTVEYTFRFTHCGFNGSSVQLGWNMPQTTIFEITGNEGLKFTYNKNQNGTDVLEPAEGEEAYANVSAAMGFVKSEDKDFEWISAKVEVTNGVLTGHSFTIGNKTFTYSVNYEKYNDRNDRKLEATDLYFRIHTATADISEIRVVKGVGYDDYTGEMKDTSYSELSNDNTLYYQKFGQDVNGNNTVASIAEAGMTVGETGVINNNGYFEISTPQGQNRRVGAYLPIQLPQTGAYTVALNYRYTTYGNANTSSMQIGWGECTSGYYHLLQFQTGNGLRFTEYKTEGDASDTSTHQPDNAWPDNAKKAMTTNGNWIKVEITVDNSKISKCTFTVDGQSFEMLNSELEYNLYDITMGVSQLYFRALNATVEVESIRVTKGADISAYNGVYATTSYNGYEDPMVSTVGLQTPAPVDGNVKNNAIRLVGEIRGTDFSASGFKVSINYNGNTYDHDLPINKAYKSIKAGNGTETPSSLNYYLIVVEIENLPAASDTDSLEITFTPYGVADGKEILGREATYYHSTGKLIYTNTEGGAE